MEVWKISILLLGERYSETLQRVSLAVKTQTAVMAEVALIWFWPFKPSPASAYFNKMANIKYNQVIKSDSFALVLKTPFFIACI